ncbi:hypothetical protein VNI00_004656 [Paramarasmius palmivorus]|uniref:Uncharacterized protein n=1 Tax=Paramarasmius palmivorus TaxID=297713 RepID=A0AAW0DLT0_9AGAR
MGRQRNNTGIIPSREERVRSDGSVRVLNYSPGKGRSDWDRTDEWSWVDEDGANSALQGMQDGGEALYDGEWDGLWDKGALDSTQTGNLAAGKKRKRKTMRAVHAIQS